MINTRRVPFARQGLLRDLYKAQGHSASGLIEWDWSKFEVQFECDANDASPGEGALLRGAQGEQGDLGIPVDNKLRSPVSPAAMDGIVARTQVTRSRLDVMISDVVLRRVPNYAAQERIPT